MPLGRRLGQAAVECLLLLSSPVSPRADSTSAQFKAAECAELAATEGTFLSESPQVVSQSSLRFCLMKYLKLGSPFSFFKKGSLIQDKHGGSCFCFCEITNIILRGGEDSGKAVNTFTNCWYFSSSVQRTTCL